MNEFDKKVLEASYTFIKSTNMDNFTDLLRYAFEHGARFGRSQTPDSFFEENKALKKALDIALKGSEDAQSLWCSDYCSSTAHHSKPCVRAKERITKIKTILEGITL